MPAEVFWCSSISIEIHLITVTMPTLNKEFYCKILKDRRKIYNRLETSIHSSTFIGRAFTDPEKYSICSIRFSSFLIKPPSNKLIGLFDPREVSVVICFNKGIGYPNEAIPGESPNTFLTNKLLEATANGRVS